MNNKVHAFCSNTKALACDMMSNGVMPTLKKELASVDGAITLGKIGMEAISALILIVIWVLIPQIGSAITDNMPSISADSAWNNVTSSGIELWGQVEPMLRVCVIVVIVALILKVIYDLKGSGSE